MDSTKLYPPPPPPPPPTPNPTSLPIELISAFIAFVVITLVMLFMVCITLCRKRMLAKKLATSSIIAKAEYEYVMRFSELQICTNNFDDSRLIGSGGFGKVYWGELADGRKVAVKRANKTSRQGINEFVAEIDTLFKYRHGNIVSLVGYCDYNTELILVYQFIENGALKSHLYGSSLPSLSWKQRLKISIGAAKGLHYLHTAYMTPLVHRDIKSSNILLDINFNAKVADFGISRVGPNQDETHVSTDIKGTFGYLDPEYYRRRQLTEKSDIYSFGVLLIEILCAKDVLDGSLPKDVLNLKDWAIKSIQDGQLPQIIDPNLVMADVNHHSLMKFIETAQRCVVDSRDDRPFMKEVLSDLEDALQQDAFPGLTVGDNSEGVVEPAHQDERVSSPFLQLRI